MIVFSDVGGTNTRIWSQGKGKISELIIGLRGVWTAAEKSRWKRKLSRIAPKITVLSDIELAHRLKFGNKPGIVLNAGTGSIAYGKNAGGKSARAGGLGALLGDEGSAFWIGKEFLKLEYSKNGNLQKIRRFAKDPQAVSRIAALAKIVLKRAQRNPKSAEAKIAGQAQGHLRRLVGEVRKNLGGNNLPVHLTGGLFQNNWFKLRWRR